MHRRLTHIHPAFRGQGIISYLKCIQVYFIGFYRFPELLLKRQITLGHISHAQPNREAPGQGPFICQVIISYDQRRNIQFEIIHFVVLGLYGEVVPRQEKA